MLEMKVDGLALDPLTNMPIITLKDVSGKKVLPIWVGIFEANAIALQMEKVATPRPMTHDLIKNIIDGMAAKVNHIVVSDLKDNTFYATISLSINNHIDIDISWSKTAIFPTNSFSFSYCPYRSIRRRSNFY